MEFSELIYPHEISEIRLSPMGFLSQKTHKSHFIKNPIIILNPKVNKLEGMTMSNKTEFHEEIVEDPNADFDYKSPVSDLGKNSELGYL
ncbi:MAG: hypothetical protein OXE77_00610 [Flavobacteriaceae bacterium]|nr:hypothetical protein [Flavobacteriaceae bacterium]MCY4266331.1 hypothetical protein [Flavobacteriaceae bacterium]MCY4299295.1 hypothetical protein [Flavobacteriaceae bacterium]